MLYTCMQISMLEIFESDYGNKTIDNHENTLYVGGGWVTMQILVHQNCW